MENHKREHTILTLTLLQQFQKTKTVNKAQLCRQNELLVSIKKQHKKNNIERLKRELEESEYEYIYVNM